MDDKLRGRQLFHMEDNCMHGHAQAALWCNSETRSRLSRRGALTGPSTRNILSGELGFNIFNKHNRLTSGELLSDDRRAVGFVNS